MKTICIVLVAFTLLAFANALETKEYWTEKLVGKEIVRGAAQVDPATQFRAEDLPTPNRVLRPGQPVTYDLRRDRLNVLVDENNVATSVNYY